MVADKVDIRALELAQLQDWVKEAGEPAFRAKQIYKWIWENGATDINEMTNLSKGLREKMQNHFCIQAITTDEVQYSKDGTIKSRFQLHDSHMIEGVLIPADGRKTACVSSQVGCSLSCKFCATGKMKRLRNLTAAEIVDQVRIINQQSKKKYDAHLSNIVFMGMGEPLLNYRQVKLAIDTMCDPNMWNMSPSRFTVSTAGIAKMIHQLAEDEVRFNLALSLHAANDEKRNQIMEINKQNNLEVLKEALLHYNKVTDKRIYLEYIVFNKFNDSIQDADDLIRFARTFPCKINLIEYNTVEGTGMEKSSEERLMAFQNRLHAARITATLRRSRGKDIDAACGQLANK
ncbi:UNVERIFIED_CONTAM: hypothetical protein GTU68_045226 [Idotea baltica]|nr:hypothetical protein [Idotea baltica]